MKKIRIILFAIMGIFIFSSCAGSNRGEIYGHESSCVYYQNHLYFEEIEDNRAYIRISDLDLGNKKTIGESDDIISLSICNNKLYYIKKNDNVQAVLYAADIGGSEKTSEIGVLGEYKSVRAGMYNGCEFSVFSHNGNEYVLYNNSIYSIKDNLKTEVKNIVSVYCADNKLYYSDFDGNISEYDMMTKEIKIILSGNKLRRGQAMQVWGENVSAGGIVVNGSYLYYTGGEALYGKGCLYRCNMDDDGEPEYLYEATDKFYVCENEKIVGLRDGVLYHLDINSGKTENIAEDIIDFFLKDEKTIYAMIKKDNDNYNYELLNIE